MIAEELFFPRLKTAKRSAPGHLAIVEQMTSSHIATYAITGHYFIFSCHTHYVNFVIHYFLKLIIFRVQKGWYGQLYKTDILFRKQAF